MRNIKADELVFEMEGNLIAVTVMRHFDTVSGNETYRAYVTPWHSSPEKMAYNAAQLDLMAVMLAEAAKRMWSIAYSTGCDAPDADVTPGAGNVAGAE